MAEDATSPEQAHASPSDPVVIWNQRRIRLAGCIFSSIALLIPVLCLVHPLLGIAWFGVAILLLTSPRTTLYPMLVRNARLGDVAFFQPGGTSFPVSHIDRIVIGPDPQEDYADTDCPLYELVFDVRAAEWLRLTVTADDARRAMEWGRTRRVVVENRCDRGP